MRFETEKCDNLITAQNLKSISSKFDYLESRFHENYFPKNHFPEWSLYTKFWKLFGIDSKLKKIIKLLINSFITATYLTT